MKQHPYGFSLVELSIVLVIIGLLVGGTLAGQSLIRGAEVNKIGRDGNAYVSAVKNFRDQYRYLPGDLPTATKYWGAASSCPNGSGTGTQTCDGNGNGFIQVWDEMYRSWQHLGNAGLITGTYSGTYSLSGSRAVGVAGVNIPKGPIAQTGWSLIQLTNLSTTNFELGYSNGPTALRNWLIIGKTSSADWANGLFLPVVEASLLDTKFDDGNPASGNIWAGNECTTSTAIPSAYAVTGTSLCRLGFLAQ